MDSGLTGATALITGASGGIGSALARAFAAEGARVVLHYRSNRAAAEALAAELPTESLAVGADLANEAEVAALFESAAQRFGRLDTLVVNHGIWVAEAVPMHRMSLEQWHYTLDTDLTSTFLCCREYMKAVERQQRGNIVFIASTAAVFGEADHADYAAAKSAMAYGLTRSLKNEIVKIAPHTADYPGGRVNCVCPGWTRTPIAEGSLADQAVVGRVLQTMPLPQIARVEDIANAVVYLASDRLARHVTGQNLVLAGGMEGRVLRPAEEPNLEWI